MSKIWVVMGTTGEYSDRNEWPVLAFTDKAKAEARIVAATQEANRRFSNNKELGTYDLANNPLDPKMRMDYTGTSYFYYEVEVSE